MSAKSILCVSQLLKITTKEAIVYCEKVRRASGLGSDLTYGTIARYLSNMKPPYPGPRVLASFIKHQETLHTQTRRSLQSEGSMREKNHSQDPGSSVPKKSTAEPKTGFVKCPFCNEQVKTKKLADHARMYHADQNNRSTKSGGSVTKVESTKPAVPGTGTYFIDPSGFLVSPKLIQEEIRINGDEQPRGVTRGNGVSPQRFKKAKKAKPSERSTAPGTRGDIKAGRSMDDTFREKVEWLNTLSSAVETPTHLGPDDFLQCPICKTAVKLKKLKKHIAKIHPGMQLTAEQIKILEKGLSSQDPSQPKRVFKKKRNIEWNSISHPAEKTDLYQEANLVKCPLCKHRTQYNVLFVHLQVSHPEVNPKIVMSKFNKVNRSKDYANLSRYQDELQEIVKDYERLRQGLDEPRDGSKHVGHMRREWNGQFGSFPLHDDYGDEAEA
jgi:hypothetical protein